MTTNPTNNIKDNSELYKKEYFDLLKELREDRDLVKNDLESGSDFVSFVERRKELYVLNTIVSRMESFIAEEQWKFLLMI